MLARGSLQSDRLGFFCGIREPALERIFFELSHLNLFAFMLTCFPLNHELKKNYLWLPKIQQRFPFVASCEHRVVSQYYYFTQYLRLSRQHMQHLSREERMLLTCVMEGDLGRIENLVLRINAQHQMTVQEIFSFVDSFACTPVLWAYLNRRQAVADYLTARQCSLITLGSNTVADYTRQFIRLHQLHIVTALWPLVPDIAERQSCFLTAVRVNAIDMAHFMVNNGVDPRCFFEKNATACHIAATISFAMYHYVQSVTQLDPQTVDDNGDQVVHYAARAGRIEVLLYLERQLGLGIYQQRNHAGQTVLDCVLSGYRSVHQDNQVALQRYTSCINHIRQIREVSSANSLWRGAGAMCRQNYSDNQSSVMMFNCICVVLKCLTFAMVLVGSADGRLELNQKTLSTVAAVIGSMVACTLLMNCLMLCINKHTPQPATYPLQLASMAALESGRRMRPA